MSGESAKAWLTKQRLWKRPLVSSSLLRAAVYIESLLRKVEELEKERETALQNRLVGTMKQAHAVREAEADRDTLKAKLEECKTDLERAVGLGQIAVASGAEYMAERDRLQKCIQDANEQADKIRARGNLPVVMPVHKEAKEDEK